MLTLSWEKIDKFYLIFIITAVIMAVLLIFTFKTIFGAYFLAYDVKEEELNSSLKINKEQLGNAYNWVFQKEVVQLQIRE